MIIPHFNGRLGNNMFQVAAAIGTGKEYGILPNTEHWQHQNIYKYFDLPIYNGNHFILERYWEPEFNYNPLPDKEDLAIIGFFQSEKYFRDQRDKVLDEFRLNYNPIDYVSLHCRLTDYLNTANGMNNLPIEYYNEALSMFPNDKILVFSDDIEMCKGLFKGDKFEFSNDNEFDTLSKMASCKHNIIANSSFSWWGAWLNKNPNNIVVSPHYTQWFSESNKIKEPVDLIPSSWIQIKY